MAIAAVIVLRGRAEKSNFIDIHGGWKDGEEGKKNLLKKEIEIWRRKKKHKTLKSQRREKKDADGRRRQHGKNQTAEERGGGVGGQAGWLLNMRLFYRRPGIEWKCDKYIDIVFGRLFRLFGSCGPNELQLQQQRQGAEVAGSTVMACHCEPHWWMAVLDWNRRVIYIRLIFAFLSYGTVRSLLLWAAGSQSGEGMSVIRDNSKPVQSAAFLYVNVKLSLPRAPKV